MQCHFGHMKGAKYGWWRHLVSITHIMHTTHVFSQPGSANLIFIRSHTRSPNQCVGKWCIFSAVKHFNHHSLNYYTLAFNVYGQILLTYFHSVHLERKLCRNQLFSFINHKVNQSRQGFLTLLKVTCFALAEPIFATYATANYVTQKNYCTMSQKVGK